MAKNKLSTKSWQDAYYDGDINGIDNTYDEELQEIIWYEPFATDRTFIEFDSDEWLIKLKSGDINKI